MKLSIICHYEIITRAHFKLALFDWQITLSLFVEFFIFFVISSLCCCCLEINA